ncbi:hypothetical protein CR513_03725, partial [Mucuna pruriens]
MFTLGGYEDRVVYDMVPMEATHLLLRRPWQFDKKVIHDGVTNHFTFIHMGQRVVLKPLSSSEVQEDQKKMNVKRESEIKVESKMRKKKSKNDAEKRKVRGKEKVGEKSKSDREKKELKEKRKNGEKRSYPTLESLITKGKLKKCQGKKSSVDHSQRPRGEPRRDNVFPLEGQYQRAEVDFKDISTHALGGPMIRGRLKRSTTFMFTSQPSSHSFSSKTPSESHLTKYSTQLFRPKTGIRTSPGSEKVGSRVLTPWTNSIRGTCLAWQSSKWSKMQIRHCMTRSSSNNVHDLDPKIDRTLYRLRKIKNTNIGRSDSFNSISNSVNNSFATNSEFPDCSNISFYVKSEPNCGKNKSEEPQHMENHDRTLKELTTLDVVYQPWWIQYPQLEPTQSYELKSGLIHLLLKFHGLASEDPHKHLKEFHMGISEDYIKMKAFPFSLDGATKD